MKSNNVTVDQAYLASKQKHCTIIDVRTEEECSQGIAVGAINLALDSLNDLSEKQLSKNQHYYIICQIGIRSKIAVEELAKRGFCHIYNVEGGIAEWCKKKLPIEMPHATNQDLRYQRHYQLQGFGRQAQEKLTNAHALLIGAGGLSSSSALYLAAAGIGQITIIDDDKVSLSNLQRQIIHTTDSVGTLKVESAKKQLTNLNPDIKINSIADRLNKKNAEPLIINADIVIDGSDNLMTRYLVNDLCLKNQTAMIYAAVYQYEAQISTFDFSQEDSPCLRCLFPQITGFEPTNCTTEGVLGVVPGLAGIMQATEAIKLITGVGTVLTFKLLMMDLLDNNYRTIKYSKNNNCDKH